MIEICVSPQSKTKVGRKRAGSPLSREGLSGGVHQASRMAVINEDQSLLVVSPIGAADGHICSQTMEILFIMLTKMGYNQTEPKQICHTCKTNFLWQTIDIRYGRKCAVSSKGTVKSILVEITQRSQRGAEPSVSLFTHQVGLARLQQQRAPLKVHVDFTQLLQTAAGSLTHEHRSPDQEVIQTKDLNKHRGQMV